ncbi:MAG: hypothetical protein HY350_00540 [Candidatus Omnitrophica bacterium]|nr:hypothetical protein [Candidatus Omnitrophota bacterium]
MSGKVKQKKDDEGSDYSAVNKGYISITPVHFNLTHYSSLHRLKGSTIKWP